MVAVVGTFVIFSFQYFIRGREIRGREVPNIFNVKGIKSSVVFSMFLIPSIYFSIILSFHESFRNSALFYLQVSAYLLILLVFLFYATYYFAAVVIVYAEKIESWVLRLLIRIIGSLVCGLYLAWVFSALFSLLKIQTNFLRDFIIFSLSIFLIIVVPRLRLFVVSIFTKEKVSARFISRLDTLWIILVFLMTLGLLLPLLDTIVYSITLMPHITEINLNNTDIAISGIEPTLKYAKGDFYIFLFYILSLGIITFLYNNLIEKSE